MRAIGLVVIVPAMLVFVAALARASQRTAQHNVTLARRAEHHVSV